MAILHDTIEDTSATYEEITDRFGMDIANAILALTKNDSLPKELQIAENLIRIKKFPAEIWAVKLADRITNLQSPPSDWDKQKRIKYREDASLILEELKSGNQYLANRLKMKIDEYGKYII